MRRLRRYYRHLRRHPRFHVALLLTIVAVSSVVVPGALRLIDAAGAYDPRGYEPKDVQRGELLERQPVAILMALTSDDLLKIGLFVLAGLAWLAVGPPDGSARRARRR